LVFNNFGFNVGFCLLALSPIWLPDTWRPLIRPWARMMVIIFFYFPWLGQCWLLAMAMIF